MISTVPSCNEREGKRQRDRSAALERPSTTQSTANQVIVSSRDAEVLDARFVARSTKHGGDHRNSNATVVDSGPFLPIQHLQPQKDLHYLTFRTVVKGFRLDSITLVIQIRHGPWSMFSFRKSVCSSTFTTTVLFEESRPSRFAPLSHVWEFFDNKTHLTNMLLNNVTHHICKDMVRVLRKNLYCYQAGNDKRTYRRLANLPNHGMYYVPYERLHYPLGHKFLRVKGRMVWK